MLIPKYQQKLSNMNIVLIMILKMNAKKIKDQDFEKNTQFLNLKLVCWTPLNARL